MDRRTKSDAGLEDGQPLPFESSNDRNRRDSLVEIVTFASRCLSDSFRSFNDISRYEPLAERGATSGPDNDEYNSHPKSLVKLGCASRENADFDDGLYKLRCSEGRSIADAIRSGESDDFEHARAALAAAKDQKQLVNLRDNKGKDILRISIERRHYEAAKLVLEHLAKRCTSVEETTRILTDNVLDLERHFPDLFHECIVKNMFCHELGRFPVPSHLFNPNRTTIVATSDTLPSGWTPSSKEPNQIWTDMHPETKKASEDTSSGTIMATMHFVPIEDIAKSRMSRIVNSLLINRIPIEFFNSKMIKWLVDWKWIEVWRFWLWMLFLLDVILVGCFSTFAFLDKSWLETRIWSYTDTDDNGNERRQGMIWTDETVSSPSRFEMALLMTCLAICLFFLIQELTVLTKCVRNHGLRGLRYFFLLPWNWVKIVSCVFVIVLYAMASEDYYDRNREIVVATGSIFVWLTVLYYAQPFNYTGPLVAIVQAVLLDIIPFLAMGLVVLLGFSFASFSLKNQGYRSLPWTIQSLFYALLGEFDYYADRGGDVEFFRPWCYLINQTRSGDDVLPLRECDGVGLPLDDGPEEEEHESVTRHIFLDVYVLIEGIVLLTLLYTIMSDTHDRVKVNAKAHLTRFRAMIATDCEFTVFKGLRQRMERKTKKYLYVLQPADKKSVLRGGMKWQGKLKKTEKLTKNLLEEAKSEIFSRLDRLETDHSRLEKIETKLEELIEKHQINVDAQMQMSSALRDLQAVVFKLNQTVAKEGRESQS